MSKWLYPHVTLTNLYIRILGLRSLHILTISLLVISYDHGDVGHVPHPDRCGAFGPSQKGCQGLRARHWGMFVNMRSSSDTSINMFHNVSGSPVLDRPICFSWQSPTICWDLLETQYRQDPVLVHPSQHQGPRWKAVSILSGKTYNPVVYHDFDHWSDHKVDVFQVDKLIQRKFNAAERQMYPMRLSPGTRTRFLGKSCASSQDIPRYPDVNHGIKWN